MVWECIGIAFAIIVISIIYIINSIGRVNDIFSVGVLTIKDIIFNTMNIPTKFTFNNDINGKVVVMTGGNTGFGKAAAIEMAKRGANVIIGCRDIDNGNKAFEEFRKHYPNANIRLIRLDMNSLKSVKQFAKQVCDEVKQIDILINNAAAYLLPKNTTEDGFEMHFGVNHLAHFLLTMLLFDRIKAAPKARIVVTASNEHVFGKIHFDDINLDRDYSIVISGSQSKLANVLFTKELARRLKANNIIHITTYCFHPGLIRSENQRALDLCNSFVRRLVYRIFFISPELGAQTLLYYAFDDSVVNESGYYYHDCKRRLYSNVTDESAKRLWDLSCDLVELEHSLQLN